MHLSNLIKKLFTIFPITIFISVNVWANDNYTCFSDEEIIVKLGKSSEQYPSKGVVYNSEYNMNKSYNGTCKADKFDDTLGPFYYKAVYENINSVESESGYISLNDFVEVETKIHVYSQGYKQVPFYNVSNNAENMFHEVEAFDTGSKGIVNIRLKKSILDGTIVVPEFYVKLYTLFASKTKEYSDKPLVLIKFEESKINVNKICNISNLPMKFNVNDIISQDIFSHEKKFDGFQINIICKKTLPNEKINLNFVGTPFTADQAYFKTNFENFGIGVWNDESQELINDKKTLSFELDGNKKNLKFKLIPYLVRDNEVFSSNKVKASIKAILSKDE
ncbi:hypothetical protein QE197_22345 (plasmid) [Arsenophonus nasoniae]|uniref:Type I pilus assembly protein FimE n=1 Tax=Arsenophonus nasoniae TaxID=638 RepID=D2TXV4_9GAMM|nr:hypothetical protein [Arsenophonus nasoniae]QBY46539.1 hypothetical protein ArsFIN_51500 [Arsenophonus nasoniae]WGM08315.1 hypothetical protein QE258_23795 [Arsenophonus nasoniae]WGM13180.1 hypothetical protein QE197_22345 [Arsenophonus nasoniae]WGM17901.1 hypothetical protein QE193_21835 [Arsenophonus nasoniae]CBA72229.1 type I pilus assembly protein FimE [Arsenophonus nasoniae]